MAKTKHAFYCNITGKLVVFTGKTYRKWLDLYGSDRAIQQHFFSYQYRLLRERYGTAWLYLQMTPKFKELRKKLRLLMYAYNENSDRSPEVFETTYKKMKTLSRAEGIPTLKTVLHKKTDNRISGVWLKGIPFIYDIFITAAPKPPNAIEMEGEDLPDPNTEPEEEYEIEELLSEHE